MGWKFFSPQIRFCLVLEVGNCRSYRVRVVVTTKLPGVKPVDEEANDSGVLLRKLQNAFGLLERAFVRSFEEWILADKVPMYFEALGFWPDK